MVAHQTLINLKQPSKTSFVKQANIAHGHQQINIGVAQSSLENLSNQTNELLEAQDGKWLDRGKKAKAKELIQNWKPWEKSTGAKILQGKARSSKNAHKNGSAGTESKK